MKHIRANLLFLVLTVVICCLAYPGVLWVVGQTIFSGKATGSLITEKAKGPDGKSTEVVKGSRLIAQPFTSDEYFWSRPSAASYNATASGGSNWGASNPKLRDRVAQQIGPIVVYKKGSRSAGTGAEPRTPQQDMEAWFAAVPDSGSAIPANVFDLWVSDPANKEKVADLEPVVADMVMASGSGLDPHITLRNALSVYQLDRVAAKRTPANGDAAKTRKDIEELVKKASFAPLSGLVGEPLVNVLELNVELDAKFPVPPVAAQRG